MEVSRKVLVIDKSIDRKKRIAAIRRRGFSVFPALRLAEARSRCRPGAYDLIVVNAQDEPEAAMAFCDALCDRTPTQSVLLVTSGGSSASQRDYVVTEDPEALADRVEAVLRGSAASSLEPRKQEDQPARASA